MRAFCKRNGMRFCALALALHSLFAGAYAADAGAQRSAANVVECAKADFDSATAASEIFLEKARAQRERAFSRVKNLSARLAEAKRRNEELGQKRDFLLSVGAKADSDRAETERLVLAISAFAKKFGARDTVVADPYALKSEMERVLSCANNAVFYPLKPVPFKARSATSCAKGRSLFAGEKFRLGAFGFFVSDSGNAGFLSEDGFLYGTEYSREILAFASGRGNSVPCDTSGGALLARAKMARSFIGDVQSGGFWMYPILFFGVLAAAVFVVKGVQIWRIRTLGDADLAAVKRAGASFEGALPQPYAGLVGELSSARGAGAEILGEIAYEYILVAGARIFRGLSLLSITATVAPLFGLLGTVTGIIKTFADLGARAAGGEGAVSAGISEALITTEYGLVVAIPAFVAHALLVRRAKAVVADLEKTASAYMAGRGK